MRASVWKWPRASGKIEMLRPAAGIAAAATVTSLRGALASAGAGLIRSAIPAISTPAPAMTAANNRMSRITPLTHVPGTADLTTPSAKPRLSHGDEGRHFGEKDERSVNGLLSSAARLDPPRRQRIGRVF